MRENLPSAEVTAHTQENRRKRPLKRFWQKVRHPLTKSTFARTVLTYLITFAVKLVYKTNRIARDSDDVELAITKYSPAIAALWHGQHLLAPAFNPRRNKIVALFSRSADAELNARVAEKLGFGVVRGSGGRQDAASAGKGGARALLALKKTLDQGINVAMIADIPHGTPRSAGLGIVTLAKHSGRPILPVAIATSRRKVLERSWDKTTINLPFGRQAIALGEPIHVPPEADEAMMEAKRLEVTAALNAVTERAYRLVDDPR
jgi:lysophospholipid acyltransferase (LPLAT)-like uncharacterized protein